MIVTPWVITKNIEQTNMKIRHINWSERRACAVRRQTNAALIFFSQKKLKNFGPSEVHAPEEQQARLFRQKLMGVHAQ